MKNVSHALAASQRLKPALVSYYLSRLFQPRCLLMSVAARFYSMRLLYRTSLRMCSSAGSQYLSPFDKKLSLFPQANVEQSVSALKEDGFALGLDLPQDVVTEITRFAEQTLCYGDRLGRYGFYIADKAQAQTTFERQFQQAQYSRLALQECEAVRRIEQDPVLLSIAQRFLGTKPTLLTSRLFWSFANDKKHYDTYLNSSHFHYDLDDYGCLRFFFYISDVDDDNGPHVVIKGSHRRKTLHQKLIKTHAVRSEKTMVNIYGEDAVHTVRGTAGTGFAEDAVCFHKATRPEKHDRLMLQVTFAINDYGLHGQL